MRKQIHQAVGWHCVGIDGQRTANQLGEFRTVLQGDRNGFRIRDMHTRAGAP